MNPWALYNEIDDYAADWLENLIRAGQIAPGIVDRRSIEDLLVDDLRGFRQVHFFAGIGVWSYALRRAGVSDDTALWTGSCPCQPFSAAGKGGGVDDERHLWPSWHHLIRQYRPERILGEQVASKDGLGWLDTVSADLEAEGYTFGVVDTCSAGSGAPHIRQRLRFVAYDRRSAAGGLQHAARNRWEQWRAEPSQGSLTSRCSSDGLADDQSVARGTGLCGVGPTEYRLSILGHDDTINGLDDSLCARWEGHGGRHHSEVGHREGSVRPTPLSSELGGMADNRCGRREVADLHTRGVRSKNDERQANLSRMRGSSGSRLGNPDGGDACPERQQRSGQQRQQPENGRIVDRLDDSFGDGWHSRRRDDCQHDRIISDPTGTVVELADAFDGHVSQSFGRAEGRNGSAAADARTAPIRPCPTNGYWRDADWLFCRDGKWRPVEPGTFPLVDGAAFRLGSGSAFEGKSRQGMLKGYGNAIDAEATIDFIEACIFADYIDIELEPAGQVSDDPAQPLIWILLNG